MIIVHRIPGLCAGAALASLLAVAPAAGAVLGQPSMSVNPLFIEFPVQLLGGSSDASFVTVENAPGGSSLGYSIELSGEDTSDFTIACDGGGTACLSGQLNPGAHVNLAVTFSPLFAGERSAEIVVSGNDFTNPSDTVVLVGQAMELLFEDGFENGETGLWSSCQGCPP